MTDTLLLVLVLLAGWLTAGLIASAVLFRVLGVRFEVAGGPAGGANRRPAVLPHTSMMAEPRIR